MVTGKAIAAIEATVSVYAESRPVWTFAVARPPAAVIGAVDSVVVAVSAAAVVEVAATSTAL